MLYQYYEKAFDPVNSGKMMEILSEHNIDDKEMGIIKNQYWYQSARVKIWKEDAA